MSEVEGIPGYTKEEIVHQIEMNLWETWSHFGRGKGCTLHDEEESLWFETPIPTLPYNTVLRFQVKQDVEERIDSLVNHYTDRGVAQLWIVHPSAKPDDLGKKLEKRGLQEIEIVPGMARSLDHLSEPPPIPDGVEIREVLDQKELVEFRNFAALRWGVADEHHEHLQGVFEAFKIGEDVRFWMAWKDGKAISKLALYNGSGSAGIYAVATKTEARGMGIASILMNVGMQAAKEMGHTLCVLDSSPPAEKLYQRLGFITVAPFHLFSFVKALL
ncbi:MAG TPA: hypothetical protein DCX53_04950 [Anaerolineae bacterium]|nr:hypothetical protein [Anaerolineae bacterium]